MSAMEQMEKSLFPRPERTEKSFIIFFLWTSLVPIILLFLAGYYTTANLLQREAVLKHVALADQKHTELALFVEKIKAVTAAWGIDGRIREMTEKINGVSCANVKTFSTCATSIELSNYLIKSKIPLDTTIGIIDILSVDGIVVASSDMSRLGIDESEQQTSFTDAKLLNFGEATFFHELVSEEEEFDRRMMVHLTTPISSLDGKSVVGVLLAHTENKELNKVVAENVGMTTESYLVNKDGLMVTPSRFVPDAVLNQKVNTPPIRTCAEHGMPFQGEWTDYRGVDVFGASVCDTNLFGTLVVETDKNEVFIEITRLRNTASAILIVVLILLLGYAYVSGANIILGARHIFPSTFSSATILGIVVTIIIVAVLGISTVFTKNIEKFIIDQKTGIISSLVSQQANRHINRSPTNAFALWESPESQKRFQDFSDEILHSFQSVVAVQLHATNGTLVWSTLQNAKIGTNPEAEEVAHVLMTGKLISGASTSTMSEVGSETLLGLYVPILGDAGEIVGIAETYVDTGDIATFTKNIKNVLWVGSFIATVFIFLLLRYAFRKQDARIIAQSEELIGLISQSPIGIYTVAKNGTIETYNPAMARETGIIDSSQIIGKNVFELDYFQKSGLDNLIRQGLSGEPFKKDIEVAGAKDITRKSYHYYYGVPLKNADGEVDHLLLMSEDITERKEIENKVSEYSKGIESEYRATLAGLDNTAIVSVTDEKGNITYVNQKFIEISHYSKDELLGQNHRILKSGHQPQELFEDLWRTISGGKVWRGEIKNRAKDGSYYWVDGTVVPILGDDGKPKNYVAIRILITDRKEAEENTKRYVREIEEAKIKDEALLASLGEGMIATDNEGKVITINRVAEQMLEWSALEILGKKMVDAIPAVTENNEIVPPEKRVCLAAAAKENAEVRSGKMYFIRKDGYRVPVAVTATPIIVGGENTGAVVIFRDITSENELEKTRRDLLSLASHQLRTPLSGTKWLIETLRKGIHGTLTKNQEEYLDEIYKINVRMTTLVHDMLGVLRMEGDTTMAKKQTTSIASIFNLLLEALGSTAKSKNITITLEKTEVVSVETDPVLLRSILEGLLSNAINYSPEGSEVVVTTKREGTEVVFSIKDSGIGIPRDEQRQIFERFYRASNAKTYDTHGTGLGLYISATLAKKIGAQVTFESEAGKGSTFYVRLPSSTI